MKKGMVFWFTGLSGAGKTTLAKRVCDTLRKQNIRTVILDGDDIRSRLHRHLGFSATEIKENNSLIVGLCQKDREQFEIVLVPIISPFSESRAEARRLLSPGFFEVHVRTEISVLEGRDTKGLYAKTRNGEMDNLIGYSPTSPYEPPTAPDLIIDTGSDGVEESSEKFIEFIISSLGTKLTYSGEKRN